MTYILKKIQDVDGEQSSIRDGGELSCQKLSQESGLGQELIVKSLLDIEIDKNLLLDSGVVFRLSTIKEIRHQTEDDCVFRTSVAYYHIRKEAS